MFSCFHNPFYKQTSEQRTNKHTWKSNEQNNSIYSEEKEKHEQI